MTVRGLHRLGLLWTTVNGLLHTSPPATDFPPDWSQSLADFFMAKVTNIKQQAAAGASQLTSDPLPYSVPVDTQLNKLFPVTAEEVARLLSKTADKSSALDVIPSCLRGSQIHCHRRLQNLQTFHSRQGHSQPSSNLHW